MDTYIVRRIAIVIAIVLLVILCVAAWPRSSNNIVDLGNNTVKVPVGSELVLNEPSGKTTLIWEFTNNNGIVDVSESGISLSSAQLCGINCKKEITEWPWTFYCTQNADGSVTIEYPWGFYET